LNFFTHFETPLLLENGREESGQCKTDYGRARENSDPGKDHLAGFAPPDAARIALGSNTQNSGRLDGAA
jgi:hypothetical protein